MNIDATQVGTAPHQQIPDLEMALNSVTTAGKNTVAGYFSFRWLLEVGIRQGQVQGASTIEQQFVRVVTARFERTTTRKVREQMLAILLSSCRSKMAISSAYLAVAFYGSQSEGLKGIRRDFGCNLDNVDSEKVLSFVAQLKYPRPLEPSVAWRDRIDRRVLVLKRRGQHSVYEAGLKQATSVISPGLIGGA